MKQTVVHDRPPLWDEIVAAFPQARNPGVIFSWGDRIFDPSGDHLPPDLLAHEAVHGERQGTNEQKIRDWWQRYIEDPSFRLAEEIPAHQAEFRWLIEHGNRSQRRKALRHVTERLAAPLYRYGITPAKARELLSG